MDDVAIAALVQADAAVVAASAGSSAPAKVKKVCKQESAKQKQSRGAAIASEKHIFYNGAFQKAHAASKCSNDSGHWREFCHILAEGKTWSKCKACKGLLQRVLCPSAEVVPAEATSQPLQDPKIPGRGRPKRSDQISDLKSWVQLNRPTVYIHSVGSSWWCSVCKKVVNTHRMSYSGHRYLLAHETASSVGEAGHVNPAGAAEDPAQSIPCEGMFLNSGSALDSISESVLIFVQGNCIQCKSTDAGNGLDECSWAWHDERLALRSKYCLGRVSREQAGCTMCSKLAQNNQFQAQICLWACRIKLGEYLRVLAMGLDSDRRDFREQLYSFDFAESKLARRELDSILTWPQEQQQMDAIKRKLQGIPTCRRTERLDSWINRTLDVLPKGKPLPDGERQVYQLLSTNFMDAVQNHRMSRENLALAAKIAAGGLSCSKVVSFLVNSFLASQDKQQRGLQRVMRRPDSETLEEIVWSLGTSAESKALLKTFGVSLPHQSLCNFASDLVPQPYIAIAIEGQLRKNIQISLDQMKACGSRSFFFSIDETYWAPAYSPCSGLFEPTQRVVVGGAYSCSDAEDYSRLPPNSPFPTEKLARLTQSVVMCRTDSLAMHWEICSLPVPRGDGAWKDDKVSDVIWLVGCCLAESVSANQGLPAMGVCFDGGNSISGLRRLLLGLSDVVAFSDMPFWCDCEQRPLGLSYFPFRVLWHKKSDEAVWPGWTHCTL